MIVMRKGMRSLGMDGQGGFEMLKMAFAYTYLHSWGWGFCLGMFCKTGWFGFVYLSGVSRMVTL